MILYLPGLLGARAAEKDWLPGYIIKYDIARVSNADKLRRVIRNHKLHLIDVPRKYTYQIFGKAEEGLTSHNSIVVVEKIRGRTGQGIALNIEQTKQLWAATIDSGHYDMHCANYIAADNGKVYIIDTDTQAMPSRWQSCTLFLDWLLYGNGLHDGSGIRMNPRKFNDPSIKLELGLYSKYENHIEEAHAWLFGIVRRRERWRQAIRCGVSIGLVALGAFCYGKASLRAASAGL